MQSHCTGLEAWRLAIMPRLWGAAANTQQAAGWHDFRLNAWQGSLDNELSLLATIPSQHWLHAGRVGPKS